VNKRILFGIIIVAIVVVASFVLLANNASKGILEGNVSIGPICPVETPGQDNSRCKATPEMYSAAQITVYTSDGKTVITQVHPDANGHYRIELPASHYMVNANQGGTMFFNAGHEVVIQTNQITQHNIDIDTGIR